jgi:hypothetical protein
LVVAPPTADRLDGDAVEGCVVDVADTRIRGGERARYDLIGPDMSHAQRFLDATDIGAGCGS